MNRIYSIYAINIILCIYSILNQSAFAEYKIDISLDGVNRISLQNDRISEIVFTESELNIQTEAKNGTAFITSNMLPEEAARVIFITEMGRSIPVTFTSKIDINPTDLLLATTNTADYQAENNHAKKSDLRKEVRVTLKRIIKYPSQPGFTQVNDITELNSMRSPFCPR